MPTESKGLSDNFIVILNEVKDLGQQAENINDINYITMEKRLDIAPIAEWGMFTEPKPCVIAGPCSAESEIQIMETARQLRSFGINVFRAGIWKPRTHPGSFEGVGAKGLKWMQRAGAVCLAAGLALLSACGPSEAEQKQGAWDEFLSRTDEGHKTSVTQGTAPDLTAYPYPDTLAGTYDTQDPWYLDSGAGKSTLTAHEAKEDAEALFQLLHDFYGGYGYFGGDEAFRPALEQVLDDLSGETMVSAKSLQQSLESALTPLLLDGHFAINGHYLSAAQRQAASSTRRPSRQAET